MTTGTLAIKVVKVEPVHEDEENKNKHMAIKIRIAGETKHTKHFQANTEVGQTLNFDLKDVVGDEEVHIESHYDGKKKEKQASATWKVPLSEFMKDLDWAHKALTLKNGYSVRIESKWMVKNATQKVAGEGAAHAAEQVKQTAAAAVTVSPQRALAVHETHRPWFMRASYYYDTTKNVYNYTTSFRVIAPVARLSENTANAILQKLTGKTLHDLDGQLLVPVLDTVDNKVDATISTVLVKLVEGQNFVLKKKNDAVDTASHVLGGTLTTAGKVKDYTTSSVKSVASTGYNTVASMTDYTTSSVKSVASTGYNTVASVTDYTTQQVLNVSSSAFGKVRGATVYVVSHVPYLGAKIRT